MESGARVVTWNSSGASRVKPKVREVSLPQPAAASSTALAAAIRAIPLRIRRSLMELA